MAHRAFWHVLVIILAGLAVLLVVAWLFLRRSRRSRPAPAGVDSPWPTYLAACAAALLGGAVLVLVAMRDSRHTSGVGSTATRQETQPAADLARVEADVPGAVVPASQAAADADSWISLFDGRTLNGWKVSDVGGQDSVAVKEGAIHMGMGETTTGVACTRPVPRDGYEVSLEMTRLAGVDFPCALTFPVGEEQLTFVIGGWGGTVTGVSCIDGYDAANNSYSRYVKIEDRRWYAVRVVVTRGSVECWLDGERLIRIQRGQRKFSVRLEVEEFVPLGISTWQTHGAVRNIKLRRLE